MVLVHLLLEWNTYLHFNADIVNLVWKTNEGEGEGRKHCFVNFCSLVLLYLSVGEGLWVQTESLIFIKIFLKSHLFKPGFKPTQ